MWKSISDSARKLGDGAADQAKKAKIKTDVMMIDRSIDARKRAFGIAMYDYLSPLSQSADFYAASDKLTEIVRPTLIIAQREIQALAAKRVKQQEALAKAEADRAAAFPTKAETYGQKLMNLGKASYYHGGETKIKTEITVTDRFIKGHKEDFGVTLYDSFAAAEDNEGFLPTDRQIRNVYDTCRQDLTVLEQQKKAKEDEIVELGGKRSSPQTPTIKENSISMNTAGTPMASTTPVNNNSGGYSNPTGYGATTTSQSMLSPTINQNPPPLQVAGTGMFSHPVTNSGGYSDNVSSMSAPADPFSSGGYSSNVPSMSAPAIMTSTSNTPVVDPFSAFATSRNQSTFNNSSVPPQQSHSGDLLDF